MSKLPSDYVPEQILAERKQWFDDHYPVALQLYGALVAAGANPGPSTGTAWVLAVEFHRAGVQLAAQFVPFELSSAQPELFTQDGARIDLAPGTIVCPACESGGKLHDASCPQCGGIGIVSL